MKKIIFIIMIFIVTFIIYFYTNDKKIYFVSMGDSFLQSDNYHKYIIDKLSNKLEKYVNYNCNNCTVKTLLNDIENNKRIKYKNTQYNINNLLIKADIIIIAIGMNDLMYYDKYTDNIYHRMDDLLIDIDRLLEKIRYYSKEKIYLYNFFAYENRYLNYLNSRLNEIVSYYNVEIIDVSNLKIDKTISKEDYRYLFDKLLKNLYK